MTITKARKQARDEIRMYQHGRGWVLNSYDPRAKADRISHEMSFFSARDVRRESIIARTYELMGYPWNDASEIASLVMMGYGENQAFRRWTRISAARKLDQ